MREESAAGGRVKLSPSRELEVPRAPAATDRGLLRFLPKPDALRDAICETWVQPTSL